MKLTDIFTARRKTGQLPTMQKKELTAQQVIWMDAGKCMECGSSNQSHDSLVCSGCSQLQSIEDIRQDIETLRTRVLAGKP